MKYSSWLYLAIVICSTNVYAFESKVEIFEQFDDLRMVAFVSEKDIANSPEWNPDVSAPPLTVFQAIKAVRNFNSSSHSSGSVKEIEIRPMPKHAKHWHYLIKIKTKATKNKYDIYVVLMNGKVIPAIIEPQTYK